MFLSFCPCRNKLDEALEAVKDVYEPDRNILAFMLKVFVTRHRPIDPLINALVECGVPYECSNSLLFFIYVDCKAPEQAANILIVSFF